MLHILDPLNEIYNMCILILHKTQKYFCIDHYVDEISKLA